MAYAACVTWVARAGEEEAVASALRQLHTASQVEPGLLEYRFHRDPADTRRFFFYEVYTDEAAYQAHLASEHVRVHGLEDAIPRLELRERVFWETWEPADP